MPPTVPISDFGFRISDFRNFLGGLNTARDPLGIPQPLFENKELNLDRQVRLVFAAGKSEI
jgi:hypothetical protein